MDMNLSEIDFVKYGSALEPLDEDELPRKKPCLLEEQTAKDKQGRRRFHGAFTGGFSAGYFNTVGSNTGWKPSSFKSSRSKKEEITIQKPENFMDEEDLGEFGIAPMILKTRENYLNETKNSLKCNILSEKSFGEFVVKNYLRPVSAYMFEVVKYFIFKQIMKNWIKENESENDQKNDTLTLYKFFFPQFSRETIGVKLLKKMGWKPGQGIGPRVNKKDRETNANFRKKIYGCNLPPGILENKDDSDTSSEWEDIKFAPTDLTSISYTFKFNFFGIGYEKLQKKNFLAYDSQWKNKLFKNKAIEKKHVKAGHGFGVGVFEDEDEDIYSKDDADQYDFFLSHESQNQEVVKTQNIVREGIIDGFTLELKKSKSKHYQLPNLPNNLSLYCKIKVINLSEGDIKHYELKEKLDESARVKVFNPTQNPEELQSINSFTNTTFKEFLVASEPEDLSNLLSTVDKYSDRNEDCVRAAKLKMYGPLTRKTEEWAPCPLLSKRFNIPEPKNVYQNIIKKNTNVFVNTINSCKRSEETVEDVNKEKMEDSSFCNMILLEKKINVNTLKIDLFKEIFLANEETTESEKYCNLKEESEEIIFEEKIINSKRNTSPPRGIFEHIGLKKKSGETSSEIFHSVKCTGNNGRVLDADIFEGLFYGPKIPNTITEKYEVKEKTKKAFEGNDDIILKTLKTHHRKKHKKHKKSSHKTKHKHKNKKKK